LAASFACHYAAATAFTAAQALHVGGNRRVEVKAEAAEIVSRQNAPVRAVRAAQATHDHYAACVHRSLARNYREQPALAKAA